MVATALIAAIPLPNTLRGDDAFERSKIRLQPVTGRIRHSRIFVTLVLSDLFLNVGGSRVRWEQLTAPVRGSGSCPA